jgi:hypothetical protein
MEEERRESRRERQKRSDFRFIEDKSKRVINCFLGDRVGG